MAVSIPATSIPRDVGVYLITVYGEEGIAKLLLGACKKDTGADFVTLHVFKAWADAKGVKQKEEKP